MVSTKNFSNDNGYHFDDSSSADDSDTSIYLESKKSELNAGKNDVYRRQKADNISENSSQIRFPTRQPKCFTKNAVLARQNRLKKKKYVQNLESQVNKLKQENKSLSSILDNQSNIITQLRKELKYMRSVVANSTDISKLLKMVNYNTGMSVSTSLDKSLTLTNNSFSKIENTWIGMNMDDCFPSTNVSNADIGLLFGDSQLCIDPELCIDPLEINADTSKNNRSIFNKGSTYSNIALKEHNYTVSEFQDKDVGVCLHVSKHRVSLEFCSTCSENAIDTWNEID